MNDFKNVGELLKEAGLSQQEICNRTGINKSNLSRWVRGETRIPLNAYARIYNECEREMLKNGKYKKKY